MLKPCFIFFFLFLFNAGNAQPGKCDNLLQHGDTTVYQFLKDKLLQKEIFYIKGKKAFTRHWKYYESGVYEWAQMTGKGMYAKRNGPSVMYYEDGQVQFKTFYRNDKKVGPCVYYYPSGMVASTCLRHVLDGKWDGMVNDYYPNGNISSKKIYRNGRLMEILAYRDLEGNELEVGTLKNGNGTWIIYRDGKPVSQRVFKNGKYVRTLDPDGKPIQSPFKPTPYHSPINWVKIKN